MMKISRTLSCYCLLLILSYRVSDSASDFPWGNSDKYPSDADQCFCKLEGRIDDCQCQVDTVDYYNNMKIFPRLKSLLSKDYFRYFHYNAHKPCPFWDPNIGKCASKNCRVNTCKTEEVPPGLLPSPENKPEEENCDQDKDGSGSHSYKVDGTLSDTIKENLLKWRAHDESLTSFCDIDQEDNCPDCSYVDLTLNPERFTGYSGQDAHRIWRTIYEENCFLPPNAGQAQFSAAFLQDRLEKDLCLEKRAFYRALSGLHTSITIHLCANYPLSKKTDIFGDAKEEWGPNLAEFQRRFDPKLTNEQGPYWLKNLYFVYLLEMRALTKAASYLESQRYYTGNIEEDYETLIAVKDILYLLRSFPSEQFDESVMFTGGKEKTKLKEEFRSHFRNITRVMDCVGCDKCKLWGKLQTSGLGTALKILFSQESSLYLSRNEIVSLFNAFGRISTSIQQIEKFREQMRKPKTLSGRDKFKLEL